MITPEDRRAETRVKVESPAVLFWETETGACEVKGRAVDLGSSGAALRLGARLKLGTILWCALPSYGIYTRARVCYARGLFRQIVGLQFLAGGGWVSE